MEASVEGSWTCVLGDSYGLQRTCDVATALCKRLAGAILKRSPTWYICPLQTRSCLSAGQTVSGQRLQGPPLFSSINIIHLKQSFEKLFRKTIWGGGNQGTNRSAPARWSSATDKYLIYRFRGKKKMETAGIKTATVYYRLLLGQTSADNQSFPFVCSDKDQHSTSTVFPCLSLYQL